MSNKEIVETLYEMTVLDQDQEQATVYGFKKNNSQDNLLYTQKMLDRGGDIYDLIDKISQDRIASNYDFISLITYGWAAPISDSTDIDVPPSKADNKRRVRLVITASKDEKKVIGSVLHFFDEDETIFDEDGTSGPLQDVINSIYE